MQNVLYIPLQIVYVTLTWRQKGKDQPNTHEQANLIRHIAQWAQYRRHNSSVGAEGQIKLTLGNKKEEGRKKRIKKNEKKKGGRTGGEYDINKPCLPRHLDTAVPCVREIKDNLK